MSHSIVVFSLPNNRKKQYPQSESRENYSMFGGDRRLVYFQA